MALLHAAFVVLLLFTVYCQCININDSAVVDRDILQFLRRFDNCYTITSVFLSFLPKGIRIDREAKMLVINGRDISSRELDTVFHSIHLIPGSNYFEGISIEFLPITKEMALYASEFFRRHSRTLRSLSVNECIFDINAVSSFDLQPLELLDFLEIGFTNLDAESMATILATANKNSLTKLDISGNYYLGQRASLVAHELIGFRNLEAFSCDDSQLRNRRKLIKALFGLEKLQKVSLDENGVSPRLLSMLKAPGLQWESLSIVDTKQKTLTAAAIGKLKYLKHLKRLDIGAKLSPTAQRKLIKMVKTELTCLQTLSIDPATLANINIMLLKETLKRQGREVELKTTFGLEFFQHPSDFSCAQFATKLENITSYSALYNFLGLFHEIFFMNLFIMEIPLPRSNHYFQMLLNFLRFAPKLRTLTFHDCHLLEMERCDLTFPQLRTLKFHIHSENQDPAFGTLMGSILRIFPNIHQLHIYQTQNSNWLRPFLLEIQTLPLANLKIIDWKEVQIVSSNLVDFFNWIQQLSSLECLCISFGKELELSNADNRIFRTMKPLRIQYFDCIFRWSVFPSVEWFLSKMPQLLYLAIKTDDNSLFRGLNFLTRLRRLDVIFFDYGHFDNLIDSISKLKYINALTILLHTHRIVPLDSIIAKIEKLPFLVIFSCAGENLSFNWVWPSSYKRRLRNIKKFEIL